VVPPKKPFLICKSVFRNHDLVFHLPEIRFFCFATKAQRTQGATKRFQKMNVILVICILAVGHSLFSAIALLAIHKKQSNQLLALLLLLLSIRIGKSVAGFLFPSAVYGLSAAGAAAMAYL
jgi:hypothetical protein